MAGAAEVSMDRRGGLLLPFALSLFAHALFVLLFVAGALRAPNPEETPFQVELLQPQTEPPPSAVAKAQPAPPEQPAAPPIEQAVPPPKNQIVSPPDSPEETPEKAHLFSDRDSKALQEMIKRGEPAPPAKPPQEKTRPQPAKPGAQEKQLATKAKGAREGTDNATDAAKSEAKPSTPATRTAPVVGLSDLFVRPSELARDPMLRKGEGGEEDKTANGTRDLASLSRPELWANPGERGTPDYLPDVRQGDFTLLNTKADRFAPFVRRVGLRVFQSFSMEFKQMIYAGNVPQGRDDVEIEAVMTADGHRTDVYLKQRSGNLSSDRVLLGTLNDAIFFDHNPPTKAVAEDGRIHFVFALNASVWYGRDENGRLQPGGHWIMGVGLL